jgi:hypothetical protein
MGNRGRVSAAALTVIGPGGIEPIRRPEAPVELTDEQAEEWRAIVNRMPADWFTRETAPLLVQYCRTIVRARRLAQLLNNTEKSEELDVKEYRDLLRSEAEQSGVLMSLATKMRISQQSTYDKSKKKPAGGTTRPWD